MDSWNQKKGYFYSKIAVISHNRVRFYTKGCLHKKKPVKTLIPLFFCEKRVFSVWNPLVLLKIGKSFNAWNPHFTMKRGQNFKKSPRKRGGFQFSELWWVPTFVGTDTTGEQSEIYCVTSPYLYTGSQNIHNMMCKLRSLQVKSYAVWCMPGHTLSQIGVYAGLLKSCLFSCRLDSCISDVCHKISTVWCANLDALKWNHMVYAWTHFVPDWGLRWCVQVLTFQL